MRCKDSANRRQRARSLLRCSLFSRFLIAKVRRFPARFNKKDDFRLRSTRRIYEICGRNGKPCHNCRKNAIERAPRKFTFNWPSVSILCKRGMIQVLCIPLSMLLRFCGKNKGNKKGWNPSEGFYLILDRATLFSAQQYY